MPGQKRKREVETKPAHPGDVALQRRISGKLHHSFKEATQAAKKAKAFEVQRTVKKLKEAREKGSSDVQSLEKKLETTKELDHATLARISLARKIQKIKTLAIHPMVQSALTEAAVPSIDTIPGEVKYSILSSKILAGEVGRLCTALKELVEPPEEKASQPEGDSAEASGDEGKAGTLEEEEWNGVRSDDDDDADESDNSDASRADPAALQSALSKLGIQLDGAQPNEPSSSSSSEAGDSVVLDEDEDGEDVDDQASWESGSVDSEGNIRRAASPTPSASYSNSSPPPKRSKTKPESTKTGAGSRFLPSLAAGYIRGDSDGPDIEDADAAPERKNRRGQRARKAIWEKKYGKNANHVKKAREESTATRGRGRGRGGFVAGSGRGGATSGRGGTGYSRGGAHAGGATRGANPSGRGGRVRPPPVELPTTRDGGWEQRATKKAEEKPMHPSWVAKQKLKAREAVGGVPTQGKKIVF